MTMPTPPAAQPLFPGTMTPPAIASSGAQSQALAEPDPVNVDALCDLYDRSMSRVLYLDRTINSADAQAVFDQHQLVTEFDTVRGVSTLRAATADELAAASA